MRFRIEQRLAAPVERVEAALLDPAWYEAVTASTAVWAPELLEVADDGGTKVGLRVRYRFRGTLNPAAARVISPAKMTWVEVSTLDRVSHTVDLRIEPDHYADRLRFTGAAALSPEPAGSGGTAEPAGSGGTAEPAGSGGTAEPAGSGGKAEPGITTRVLEGDIRVKVLLVAGAVEGAVVSGLREHAAVEEQVFAAFVASDR